MAGDKHPYVIWRDGRPRFAPSAREMALGFVGEDLKREGRWLTLDEACAWAEIRYQEIVAARAAGKRQRGPAPMRRNTVEDLIEDWLHGIERESNPPLSPDTIESYRKASRALIFKPETRPQRKARIARERAAELLRLDIPPRPREPFATVSVGAVGKIELNDFFLYLRRARGHHMARAAVAAFSAAYTWGGLSTRWRLGHNPRHDLDLPQPAGRIVIYSDAEIRALLAAADALGRSSIGDSIFLGLFTSQRQRDRLRLKDEGLVDGRRHFRQSKTAKLVAVRETPQLAARLTTARARVAAIVLAMGLREEQRPLTVVVDETTGRPYVQDTYRHVFGEVRAAAVKACPSLAGKTDQDLRDTAVTWLARAGCTMSEICAITGHSSKSVQTIIKHYLGSAAELADSGIDKLVAWIKQEGIAV